MAAIINEIPRGFQAAPDDLTTSVVIPLMPQNGGAFGWGKVYVSFATDFQNAKLRVAIWNDASQTWRVQYVDVLANGGRVNVDINDGDSKMSVRREKSNASDSGTQPIGYLVESALKP
jgi:hypothetical protein